MPKEEHVVLIDEKNNVVGTQDKATIHSGNTPLHRGFSVFLFNQKGQLLLQQRAFEKKTWPGIWSNSCCGHPQLNESIIHAMQRRIDYELGLPNTSVEIILPTYRYRYERFGIVENEICPVGVGIITNKPKPNQEEVHAIKWIDWHDFLQEINRKSAYSEWCIEEAQLLEKNTVFKNFIKKLINN